MSHFLSRARPETQRWRYLPLLAAILAPAGACVADAGRLHIELVRSPAANQDPLVRAAFVRIRVDGPSGRFGPVDFSIDAGKGSLDDIPVGPDQVLTVEGLGAERNTVSRGRTGPIKLVPGENRLAVFVGLIEEFSLTPSAVSSDGSATTGAPGGLLDARAFHCATLLENGQLLVSGGSTDAWRPEKQELPAATTSAELIDGNSTRHLGTLALAHARAGHTASLLLSGNVLAAGGVNANQPAGLVQQAEVFEVHLQRFFTEPAPLRARSGHAATRAGETIAVAGGRDQAGALHWVEAYEQGQVRPRPQLQHPRRHLTLSALADGSLLAAGGFDAQDRPQATTELLAPGSTGSWVPGPPLRAEGGAGVPESFPVAHHQTVPLEDGTLLIIGGLSTDGAATGAILRLDVLRNQVTKVDQLHVPRWAHTVTPLRDGRVLVIGGFALNVNGSPIASVEQIVIDDDNRVRVQREEKRLNVARAGHSATLLQSGMLLVAGGVTSDGQKLLTTASTEIFVY